MVGSQHVVELPARPISHWAAQPWFCRSTSKVCKEFRPTWNQSRSLNGLPRISESLNCLVRIRIKDTRKYATTISYERLICTSQKCNRISKKDGESLDTINHDWPLACHRPVCYDQHINKLPLSETNKLFHDVWAVQREPTKSNSEAQRMLRYNYDASGCL